MTIPPHPGAKGFEVGELGGTRVVLFHGLTGAPSELWPLALGLASAGNRVQAPLLPGHGTTPEELARTSADEVVAAARRAVSDPGIEVIGGLSMGALLAVISTAGRPATRALILMSAALQLTGRSRLLTEVGRLPGIDRSRYMLEKGPPDVGRSVTAPARDASFSPVELEAARIAEAAQPNPGNDGRYSTIPLRWGRELGKIQRLAAAAAPAIRCPVLILHGLEDRTASPDGSRRLARLVRGDAQLRFFTRSPHLLSLGEERGSVAAEAVRFLKRQVG